MRKVVAALPAAQRVLAGAAAGRVLRRPEWMVAEPTAPPEPEADRRLRAVQRAVFARRRLRLSYAARGEAARWRTVDPVGLVEAGEQWYLLAIRDGEDRTYRLSRVRDVEELDESVTADPVDLEREWAQRREAFLAALPRLSARVRVPPARRAALLRTPTEVVAEETDGDGRLVLDLRFGGLGHAVGVIWSLAPDAEALSPPELRAALATRAAATAALHGR